MVDTKKVEAGDIKIGQAKGSFSWRLFSQYLLAYRGIYCVGVCVIEKYSHSIKDDDIEDLVLNEMREAYNIVSIEDLIEIGLSQDISEDKDLWIEKISRDNPIKLNVRGMSYALVAAAIISGGEVQVNIDSITIDLKPLGYGIQEIVEAIEELNKIDFTSDNRPKPF